MKYKMIKLFVVILILINAVVIYAQSLDSLINEAIINNLRLMALEYKVQSSEYRPEEVNTLQPPVVSFELQQVPFNTIDWFSRPYSQNLTFSQMFPLGGKPSAMAEVEKKNVLIRKDEKQIYMTELIAQLKMSYYNLWLIEKRIEIQDSSIRLLNELLNSTIRLYEINKISQADIFTIQSEIAIYETQLLIYNNQKEAEVYKLNKLLGRSLDSKDVRIDNEQIPSFQRMESFKYTQEELERLLAENNPTLKKMEAMLEMNKSEKIAVGKEAIPDLLLGGMLMRMPRGMPVTAKTSIDMVGIGAVDYGYSLMASVTLPFMPWSKDQYEAKQQEIEVNIKSIRTEKDDMQRDLATMLKTSFVKMKTSWDLIRLYSENVIPLYEKARASQISLYQNNQGNINTVIDAGRMLLMHNMNLFISQADYYMSIAEMEMIVGRKL